MKTASKAEMARELGRLGCALSFNTLRKYPRERLEAMLAEHRPAEPYIVDAEAPELCTPVAKPTYIPTDAEIMRAAAVQRDAQVVQSLRPEPRHGILAAGFAALGFAATGIAACVRLILG